MVCAFCLCYGEISACVLGKYMYCVLTAEPFHCRRIFYYFHLIFFLFLFSLSPLQEEQSGGGCFNYDVELIHFHETHRDILIAGLLVYLWYLLAPVCTKPCSPNVVHDALCFTMSRVCALHGCFWKARSSANHISQVVHSQDRESWLPVLFQCLQGDTNGCQLEIYRQLCHTAFPHATY